jgi:uncharacterized protein YbjT (DUF2867 family)
MTSLRGARAAYLCLPPDPDLLRRTRRFLDASAGGELRRVVNMSQLHVSPFHRSPLTELHWQAERELDSSSMPVTHLRSTFFSEGYLVLGAAIRRPGTPLALPFGSERVAPIACADIGRVAAHILTAPDHQWEPTYTPTGPDLLDHDAIANALSLTVGRPVTYVDVDVDLWRAQAIREGFPAFIADHFAATAEDVRRGTFARVTTVVKDVTSVSPKPFQDCLEEWAASQRLSSPTVHA